MKLVYKIKTEPVTQATIIIDVVAFASGSLATIAISIDLPITGIICITDPHMDWIKLEIATIKFGE